LHEAVRRRAAEEGMTVSEYILDLLQRDLARPSRRQWLCNLITREPIVGVDIVAALDGIRDERERGLIERVDTGNSPLRIGCGKNL
jgi:hypothetical protein